MPDKPKQAKAGADFLTLPDLARKLGVQAPSLLRWVDAGTWPPSWTTLGKCRKVWRASHYQAFVATGQWPAEAWPKRGPSTPG